MIGYRPDFHMRRDFAEYGPLRKAWTRNNWANNGGDFTRFYALYQNVRQVLDDGVEGALVELGVYKGNSAAVLAGLGRATGRQTYLFDTFDGFDVRDLKGIDERHPVQFTNTSLASVRALVGEDAVTYVPGFFPDTLKDIEPISAIAVAHVDCDLHDPMKAALEAFYPLVSPGGLIIMHDYSSGFWPGATRAVDDFFRTRPEKPVLIPDKSGRAIVRKV